MPSVSRFIRDTDFYPFDVREFDPQKCFRLFSAGVSDATNTSIILAGGARSGNMVVNVPINEGGAGVNKSCDQATVYEYGASGANFIRLTGRDNGASNVSRSWLSDRWLPRNGQLFFGQFEMDTTCRVRYFSRDGKNSNFCPRIGWSGGHQDYDVNVGGGDPTTMSDIAAFLVSRNETTWRTHTCATQPDSSVVGIRTDTGIRCDEWHTLRVWVSKDAKEIVYSIDGVAVDRITDPRLIASLSTIVASGNGMQGGAVLRGFQTGLTDYPQLDIEWCLIRIFMDR